jgi:hypothetical protein
MANHVAKRIWTSDGLWAYEYGSDGSLMNIIPRAYVSEPADEEVVSGRSAVEAVSVSQNGN